jgi:hypothetical protein
VPVDAEEGTGSAGVEDAGEAETGVVEVADGFDVAFLRSSAFRFASS